ncbi:hypothetical protein PIROE2DRAFT_42002 [Piromyces sp. E2]|nr:hypothetical protein PIROE2DRAFT_42002 [Piromyces sp. E2]|eukprot:OUM65102.1 hypothetical protein PIROE2DRAFT_42002 [Piromyces sp. E2]
MDCHYVFDELCQDYVNRIIGDVTFSVNNGECLGLLGPDGAGKTTAISMISGMLSHTCGTIIYGDRALENTKISNLSLGFCAQNNSLWNTVTVKETIQFYLNISGYPTSSIPKLSQNFMEVCGIEHHANKWVCNISGGTKRKLSLIIAICSIPHYLILDELSAGMDPFTRRYIWRFVKELKKIRRSSIILTSHSTEEAEALCERIAILITGELVCIDTPRSIKMVHSNRYTLEIYSDNPENFETFEEEYVKKRNMFGDNDYDDKDDKKLSKSILHLESKKKEEKNTGEMVSSSSNSQTKNGNNDSTYSVITYFNHQKYEVKIKNENISKIFAYMEEAKDEGLINQYNFGQISLEQVYINLINKIQ